jgi:hypothetical protein
MQTHIKVIYVITETMYAPIKAMHVYFEAM